MNPRQPNTSPRYSRQPRLCPLALGLLCGPTRTLGRDGATHISPDLCTDGRWLGEENGEVVWCYTRADASGAEKDTNGATIWHPVEPVKWYHTLPGWAE